MPLSDRLRAQPAFFWIALAVATVLFGLYPFAVSVLVRTGGRERDFGWIAGRDAAGRLAVTEVTPGGPADGRLMVGDLLLSVNGQPQVGRGLGWLLFMDLRPAVLQRSLAKDRAPRFSTAREMQAALLPALRSCSPLQPRSAAADAADTTL